MKYCQKCGTEMEDSDMYCLACGTKSEINQNTPNNTYPDIQYPYYQNPYMKRKINPLAIILPIAAVLIIGAVLLIVLLTGGSNTPTGIIQKYLDASKRGDLQGAIQCLTPEAQDATNSLLESMGGFAGEDALSALNEYGANIQDNLNAMGITFNYKIIKEEISGDNAVVYVEFEIQGNKQQYPIQCEKQNGKWYISVS